MKLFRTAVGEGRNPDIKNISRFAGPNQMHIFYTHWIPACAGMTES